jgi:CheY-like chemotaxis protein
MIVHDRLVMIIEDDPDVREAVAEALDDLGYPSLSAANGKEGIDRLTASPKRPCVILLDLMMPIMDGRQFRAAQLEDSALSSIPVLVLSAQTDAPKAAEELHAAGCLRKPVDLPMLLKLVQFHCPP